MRISIFFLTIFASCTGAYVADRDLPPRKQKQKIASLQKKVEAAQVEEQKVKKEIASLNEEIRLAQISLIRKQLVEFEKKKPHRQRASDPAKLFLREREQLHEMIQNGPSSIQRAAESLLDQILRIVTEASDET